jgi:hypothetical protein
MIQRLCGSEAGSPRDVVVEPIEAGEGERIDGSIIMAISEETTGE